ALALAVAWTVSMAPPLSAGAGELSFNRDIRPILSQNCFACHGFDAKQRQADLRLDLPEQALAVRDGKTAIKPGDLAQSEVWKRINSTDPDEVMPPPDSKKTLSAEQKETLRRWIEAGAAYQKHWAFEPPVKAAEPAVRDASWPRNAVDRFILARLEAERLAPRAEADKETLVRRAAFALTGLPPSVAEVDRYLADPSPRAYEELVERYLASPRFGEEMARHWLDLARYADTHGLHLDNERQMWAYRDWVVKAFNDNLPFDQFTVWQLAGDLLPGATAEQLTATGFNRCNVTTSEGGAINDEFVYRYAVDRASTTMQTWLGLTGGCAVCHDHKYDPLSTKEFYSFYAFFNSAADPGMDKNINDTEPFYQLPRAGQQEALEAARKQEAETKGRLEQAATATAYADPAEKPPASDRAPMAEVAFDDFFPLGASVRNTSRNASTWLDRPRFGAPSGRRVLRQANAHFHEEAVQLALQPIVVPIAATFETWLYLDPHDTPGAIAVVIGASSGTRRAWWGDEGSPEGGLPGAAANERLGRLPPPGAWTKLTFSAESLQLKPGDTINSITLQEAGGVACWDAFAVTGASVLATDPAASFKVWRKALAGKSPGDVPSELQAILTDGPDKQADPRLQDKLRHFYLAYVARPASDELAARRQEWQAARSARLAAEDAIAGTMIFRDLAAARDSFVMLRGQYDKPGEKIEPGVPAVFPPLTKAQADGRANRLDLARWLVSTEQPLAARVQANRLWQQFFGTGLVKTSYDFGTQGELPSHPELLDWLAIQFRGGGWNVKDFVRLLLASAAFRQQSYSSPELRKRDPENRLYARGPRFRLDAEQVRDNALFVSGLINLEMGGRGVHFYQPPNLWEPVGYSDSNTRYYLQDHGPALYRRSLYAFLKRTAPPPFMSNFDGPNREQFCTRRERGNTPLQALQLMNDVQHFEAARALAERAIGEGGSTPADRVAFLYRTVLSRRPDAEESQLVCQAFDEQLKLFQAEPEAAARAIGVGESAPKKIAPDVETTAWTLVANLILNLDETANRN
ncbi:MAG TPA: PSD1 and planctomycete cytochrome C domain-containing protein, partial [Pirellulales bacterium]|nr:PSD1 and planctomycete cytochrome C domain-containing protein [Pirellulales bacterium]